MAVVKSFYGFHYSLDLLKNKPFERLVAPPYDIISEKDKKRLTEDPDNIVHITLGKNEKGYVEAAQMLKTWIQQGKIQRDPSPSLYIYEQEYTINSQPERKKRTGFVGLVRLEEFDKKIIMPHEKTMPKYSLDRLELLRATHANLEQIFGVYNDSTLRIDTILEENKTSENFLFQFEDWQRTLHTIWRLSDQNAINQIRLFMNPRTIIIADGHHRYETSLMYRQEIREKLGDPMEPIPADYVMMTLINIKNPGLLALPTHRLIHGLPENQVKGFFDKAKKYFEVNLFANEKEFYEYYQSAPSMTIGVYSKVEEIWGTVTLKRPEIMDQLMGTENVNRYIDTSILHELIMKKLLGIDEEMQKDKDYVDYLRGTKDVVQVPKEENKYQVVFIMKPTPLDDVEKSVLHSQRMPQKSTYFYPKVWSGLVIRLLEDEC
jgi:uncharacterized protein (DUF1015 family)